MKPDLIKDHALLLEDVITMLTAERGFIVLYDPTTKAFGEYVAVHSFDPLPERWKSDTTDDPFREINHLWDVMSTIMLQGQPVLTNNTNVDAHYFRNTDMKGWSLRFILAVPLVYDDAMYGLLWSDQRVKQGVWQESDLARVVDLVHQFLR